MTKSSKTRKILPEDKDVKEMILSATKGQILETFNLLYNRAVKLNGGIFGAKLAHLTGLLAQLRKYSMRTNRVYQKR